MLLRPPVSPQAQVLKMGNFISLMCLLFLLCGWQGVLGEETPVAHSWGFHPCFTACIIVSADLLRHQCPLQQPPPPLRNTSLLVPV